MFRPGRVLAACLAALVLGAASPSRAEDLSQQGGVWTSFTFQGDAQKDLFGFYLNLQTRSALYPPDYEQLIFRPAVYVKVTEEFSAWAGGDVDPTFVPKVRQEYRTWQQVQLVTTLLDEPRIVLTNRPRLEERLLEGAHGVSLRFRYLLALEVGLERDVSLLVWEQPFFNLDTVENGPRAGFDENRFFLGFAVTVDEGAVLELGYLNRTIGPNAASLTNTMQHFFYVGFAFTFE